MMKRGKKAVKRSERDPNAVLIEAKEPENPEEKALLVARSVLRPTVQAAATLKEFNKGSDNIEVVGLMDALVEQVAQTNANDLKRAEAILISQAHTLDALFNTLARRSALNLGEHMGAAETYLRLALKAQSQCRATLETLATIKNPSPVAFVRQANIAAGPQQVNNGTSGDTTAGTINDPRTHAREKFSNSTNELLENHHERVELKTPDAAVGADPALETVGGIERTKDRER
jgi:hypothetical protein